MCVLRSRWCPCWNGGVYEEAVWSKGFPGYWREAELHWPFPDLRRQGSPGPPGRTLRWWLWLLLCTRYSTAYNLTFTISVCLSLPPSFCFLSVSPPPAPAEEVGGPEAGLRLQEETARKDSRRGAAHFSGKVPRVQRGCRDKHAQSLRNWREYWLRVKFPKSSPIEI